MEVKHINMNQTLKQVQEFHLTFEHPIGEDSGVVEDLKIRQLRIKLLFEELKELAEAGDVQGTLYDLCKSVAEYQDENDNGIEPVDGNNVNKIEELDALCDLQYVLNGKIITAGLQFVFDRGFDQVHKNNMTKAHRSHEHALETALKAGLEGYKIIQKPGGVILASAAGKIIKPHDHVKVKLEL
jgi:predicted HAD superfamily Cof-like phosphohydrolase